MGRLVALKELLLAYFHIARGVDIDDVGGDELTRSSGLFVFADGIARIDVDAIACAIDACLAAAIAAVEKMAILGHALALVAAARASRP